MFRILALACLLIGALPAPCRLAHAQEAPATPPASALVPSSSSLVGGWTANVMEHGAMADGVADDTPAFQAALDAATAKGGLVYVPAGTYRIDGALNVPQGVTLRGVWESPHHAEIGKGTVLYATGHKGDENGPPLISLNQSSGVHGLTVFYPEQDPKAVAPYPWCIQGKGMHGSVINVTLVNPYKGIDFGTNWNELHYISNVFGQPLRIGIYVNNTTDIGRIENVHFNPHSWKRAAHPSADFDFQILIDYLKQNFEGFVIGKTDWEYMRDCFCIFPRIGYHFVRTDQGEPNAVLTQCGADICPVAVQIDASQGHAGIAFSNGQFMSSVIVGPENNGPIKFTNCGFWPTEATKEQVIVNGHNTVTLNACHFAGWGVADPAASCVRVDGGVLIMNACDFLDAQKTQLTLGEKAEAASIVACRLRGGEKIVNNSANAEIQKGQNLTR